MKKEGKCQQEGKAKERAERRVYRAAGSRKNWKAGREALATSHGMAEACILGSVSLSVKWMV